MNALFLLAAVLVAFVFGYRFFAKLLALDVFRLDRNYSTPAQAHPDARDYVPTHPHLLFGHHVAAIAGATTFVGPIVALAWGWVPAFLWLIIGSTVAAGTYGLGSFWLAVRQPGGVGNLTAALIGRNARLALLLLALLVLFIAVAASAGLTAALLAAFPQAALPTASLVLVAMVFGGYLHGRAESQLLPATAVAFAASMLLVWLLGYLPFGFAGELNVTFGPNNLIAVDAAVVWIVVLLVYTFHAVRLPVWRLMRPRGFVTALLLAVTLLLFYGALAFQHPTLVAPEFHGSASATGPLPWLFVTLGSGALAGFQLLIVYGVTGRQLRHETDARYIGYGAALVEGLIALSALLIAATAFADTAQWTTYYATVPSVTDFPRALVFYVDGYVRLVAALGLDPRFVRALIATVLASLTLAVLEASVRALKHLVAELAPVSTDRLAAGRRLDSERVRLWLIVGASGVLALYDGDGLGGLRAWPLLAIASLWLAAAGFALMALNLQAAQRASMLLYSLSAVVATLALWSSVALLGSWWDRSAWVELTAGSIIVLLGFTLIVEGVRTWRRQPRAPVPPPHSGTELDT